MPRINAPTGLPPHEHADNAESKQSLLRLDLNIARASLPVGRINTTGIAEIQEKILLRRDRTLGTFPRPLGWLRPRSAKEAAFVAERAKRFGIPVAERAKRFGRASRDLPKALAASAT